MNASGGGGGGVKKLGSTCAGSMTTDGLFAIHFIITDSFINVLYHHTMAPIIGKPGTF